MYAAPNKPPVAVNDAASTARGKSVAIAVLANDYDPDGALAIGSVAVTAAPANGTATPQSNGSVVYKPKGGFTGTDSFKYTVNDNQGAVSNQATVTVTVKSLPRGGLTARGPSPRFRLPGRCPTRD